jgi:hypothetical protein
VLQAATDEVEEEDVEEEGVVEAVKAHPSFQNSCSSIFRGIDVAFERVLSFCTLFGPFKKTFVANEVALGRVEDKYDRINLPLFEADIGACLRVCLSACSLRRPSGRGAQMVDVTARVYVYVYVYVYVCVCRACSQVQGPADELPGHPVLGRRGHRAGG